MWKTATRIKPEQITEIPETKHKKVSGHNIAYKELGEGFPVFLITSWPESSTEYLPLMYALKDHLHLISLDQPGWVGSSSRPRFKPTLKNYADITRDFIDSFGFESYGMLGYSIGGVLAEIITSEPDTKVSKLALVSTLTTGRTLYPEGHWVVNFYQRIKNLPGIGIFGRSMLKRHVTNSISQSMSFELLKDSAIFKHMLGESRRISMKAIMGAAYNLVHSDFSSYKTKVKEVIVVYGDSDPEPMKEQSRQVAEKLGIEPIYLEGADHNHLFTDVDKSSDIILNFMTS